ncbi:hypothetical protein SAMN05878503_11137 [Cereibacter ovatus]|uniref:DUF2497 domain-containing protein n=1 Tax=Cereibacter ovatus TaxID=439529 RepID=A0A285CWK0_9RHOB|nr:hypothetical protein [Cereibacter ovatus]SNX71929.1 hypothetical protein SAMN05878503_11137 [Cereibacter ovatus]
MSERMTNVDYGDVLSSIRRLVEQEGSVAAGEAVGAVPLVLTPALRVADSGPPAPFVEVEAEGWPRIVADPPAGSPADDAAEAEAIARIMAADQGPASGEPHLRDLVREVVREELQGAMGERITRNLRKLIRAEIHRALLTRDLN